MSEEPTLEEAWQALRPHWAIEPAAKQLPATPFYSGLRLLLSPLLRPLLRWRICGAHHIPRDGATILAANHLSHVDPLAASQRLAVPPTISQRTAISQTLDTLCDARYRANRDAARAWRKRSPPECGDHPFTGKSPRDFSRGYSFKEERSTLPTSRKTGVARLAAAHPEATVIPLALVGTREVMEPQHHKWPRFGGDLMCVPAKA